MNQKTLLGVVGVIVLFVVAAYFAIQPRLAMGPSSATDVSDTETVTTGESIDDSEAVEEEDVDDDVEAPSQETPVTQPAPKPTPAPTPTPSPAPTPAPAPSGYTLAQVAAHATKESCWTTIGGSVYDITPYVPRHPGGEKNILKVCGKDGSSLFEGQHGGESKPESALDRYRIGDLI